MVQTEICQAGRRYRVPLAGFILWLKPLTSLLSFAFLLVVIFVEFLLVSSGTPGDDQKMMFGLFFSIKDFAATMDPKT